MYFTRKKTTLHSSLYHLEEMTVEQKHNHLLEIFKLGLNSLNTILQPKSKVPIHFIIPIIYNESLSDRSLLTTNSNNILSDILGMVNSNESILYPKVVIDNLFSEEAHEGIKNLTHPTGLTNKSITRKYKNLDIPNNNNILPLEGSDIFKSSNISKTEQHYIKYSISERNKVKKREVDENNDSDVTLRLLNTTKHLTKNKTFCYPDEFPTNLMTIEYNISLSELGEFIVQLIKMFKKEHYRQYNCNDKMDVYSYEFTNTMHTLLNFNNKEHTFINAICERLGIKDVNIKDNMVTYVYSRTSSKYEDSIRQFNNFQLSKEKLILDSEYIVNHANTFVSVTFFIYFKTHPNLLNKPTQIVAYNYDMTRLNNLHGRIIYKNNNCPIDNYKHKSYITTINTAILPPLLTNFVLKSKMSDLEKMQQFTEVPETDFLSTKYNSIYFSLKEDFIFYDDEKIVEIANTLSSWINIRFDKNIQINYFPEFPSQYPLSFYSYKTIYNRSFERYFKEMFFEYIGIEIDYSKPISTYLKTINSIFESLHVLDTDTEKLINKEFKDYVYTWLIVLYLQNNILFKYTRIDTIKTRISKFLSSSNFPRDSMENNSDDFLDDYWYFYGTYARVSSIYPMLLETVYIMLQNSTVEEVCLNLKTTLLPNVEIESKTQIYSISKLYNIDDLVTSWAESCSKEKRRLLYNNEDMKESKFVAIRRLLYNQFMVTLKSITSKSFKNNEYDNLLKHILVSIKSIHYFISLRNCFITLLRTDDPNSYISLNYKRITTSFKEESKCNEIFELNQIVDQYIKKYPKTVCKHPSDITIDKLLNWYKDIHLTFDIETF